jgi:hypothetical protein
MIYMRILAKRVEKRLRLNTKAYISESDKELTSSSSTSRIFKSFKLFNLKNPTVVL